ncbi:phosphoribosyl-AMP cyclohydrolase [Salinibius halmophilus]|uniref:phosphoribosyl-AMP cyclohydrolase n=1 Tax=Salinibius halmophilus TaxID=1853216 RepID=UPI000E66A66E|nr:phosphoribosyl-AMP cyclohydrolase [Salinibius halmophilus]
MKAIETAKLGAQWPLSEILDQVKFNDDGLVPVIAQQFDTKEVLMMAWANREAILETLSTGRMCYWSRSRQSYWRKGESSGHAQHLHELRLDCDGDAILALIDQTGPACHTNRRSCFYLTMNQQTVVMNSEPQS